jgi:hypothetical protein
LDGTTDVQVIERMTPEELAATFGWHLD